MEEFEREIMELINKLGTFEKYWEQGISRHRSGYDPSVIEIFRDAQAAVYEAKSALEQAADYLDDRF